MSLRHRYIHYNPSLISFCNFESLITTHPPILLAIPPRFTASTPDTKL